MAENVSENELSSLTENQQAVLKVLADADGETLRGKEVRQRLNEDYSIDLNRQGMNAVRRKNSRYPNQMTEAHFPVGTHGRGWMAGIMLWFWMR